MLSTLMFTLPKRRMAEQLYDAGSALFQEGRYEEAFGELNRAQEAFREIDVRGHPFTHPLSNGISGLANTLFLQGLCCQKLGDYNNAAVFYETSLINSKFEKKKPFQAFQETLRENMAACYEKELETIDATTLAGFLKQEPKIDTAFSFPFSLDKDRIPIARIYELAPERYRRFGDFYETARKQDAEIRKRENMSDAATTKKMSIYVWGIIFTVWSAYTLIVVKALFHK
jgi:tetratricopeptide (TPR) repeat protein